MRLTVVFVFAIATMILSGLARFMGWRSLPTALLDVVFLTSTAASLALIIAIEAQRLRRHLNPDPDDAPRERTHHAEPADDPSDDA